MPLRARLTAAFLIVVLGPVLLGAVFIGTAVDTASSGRAVDKLDSAASAVTSTVTSVCDRLAGAAEAVALLSRDDEAVDTAAQRAVGERRVAAVEISDGNGDSRFAAGEWPTGEQNVRTCGAPARDTGGRVDALVAKVAVRDDDGDSRGTVTTWQPVDAELVERLSAVSDGVEVAVADGRRDPLSSFESADMAEHVLRAAAESDEPGMDEASGQYVRGVPSNAQAPLPLVLSVEPQTSRDLLGLLVGIVLLTALLAVVAATWLARSTTRPLAELADGADAVARGDLAARVPVRGNDELATVARTFNRMARETQGYVQALTSSRDQLRGQLSVLGETLSSTLDLDRILNVIVDTAMSVNGARAGIMLLVDPADPQLLHGRAGEGITSPAGGVTAVRARLGEGLLGRVAAEGVPRRGRVPDGEWAPGPAEPECGTYLAVPIKAVGAPEVGDSADPVPIPGTLLGVLAIFDRTGGDEFNDADLSTLRTFADQAAVAVGNVLAHHETQRLSLTDPLTGLWNYRYLQVSMERETERAGRFHRRAAVIAIDLDRFKMVNDTYGHPAGDIVLSQLSERITAEIRDVDLAFRYGGEEFVVLLPEADLDGARRVAERLSMAVRGQPMTVPTAEGSTHIDVTVSLGIAVFPDHGPDGASVLSAADEALYVAKSAGRDTWRVAGDVE